MVVKLSSGGWLDAIHWDIGGSLKCQRAVCRIKPWSLSPNKPPPPLALPRHSAGCGVCCFESHSHAPEGLLIPISDNDPQCLIIYSCPPVNNKTKQNKTKQNKMIERDERGQGSQSLFLPESFHSLHAIVDPRMTIAIKIITVYTAVTSLSSQHKFSISRLICFRGLYLFNKGGGIKSLRSFHETFDCSSS